MTWRDYLKPHEAELLHAVDHHLQSARETANYTRRLIRDRCIKRKAKS